MYKSQPQAAVSQIRQHCTIFWQNYRNFYRRKQRCSHTHGIYGMSNLTIEITWAVFRLESFSRVVSEYWVVWSSALTQHRIFSIPSLWLFKGILSLYSYWSLVILWRISRWMMRKASSSDCQKYWYCEMLLVLVMAFLLEKFCTDNFLSLYIHK